MSSNDKVIIESLRQAVKNGTVPEAAKDHAQHLLHRLSSPVRVTLMGRPGSGKSELLNMLIGQRILPKNAGLPTLELVFGTAEKAIVTNSRGQKSVFDSLDFDEIRKKKPAFLRFELPLEILKRISILEVVTDGALAELSSAIDWAVRRTDIAVWCTQNMAEDEQTLWAKVPDGMKDHAFLALTKADVLSSKKELSKRILGMETIVAEEFHSMFAVATLHAQKAQNPDGSVDEAKFHASGGGALSSELLRHAERGRRADFDSAQLFLVRHKIPEISPAAAAKVAQPDEDFQPRAISELPPRKSKSAPKEVAAQESDIPAKPASLDQSEKAPEVENVTLFSDAARFLRRRGEGLSDKVGELETGEAGGLVEQCVDAVEHLVDLFSNDNSGCPAADAFIDDLSEASELMVLMQVEGGDAPAADAVTLLLQLRRDIEMSLAA